MQQPKLQRGSFLALNLSDLLGAVGRFSLVSSMGLDFSLFSGYFLISADLLSETLFLLLWEEVFLNFAWLLQCSGLGQE